MPAAGESYAGVYVPLLAQSVLKSNAAPASVHKINLKVLKHAHWAAGAGGCAVYCGRADRSDARLQGYLVGNPTTNRAGVYDSEPHFALYKALIGRPLFEGLVAACDNVFHNITPGACRTRGQVVAGR